MKKVKAFVAISSKNEGSNIYLPGHMLSMPIYETREEGLDDGWERHEIVECIISYKPRSI
jgi:hypothetical protein